MIKESLPSHKPSAEKVLTGMKSSLIELVELIAKNELSTISQISGHCWSQIEKIDKLLEGDHE